MGAWAWIVSKTTTTVEVERGKMCCIFFVNGQLLDSDIVSTSTIIHAVYTTVSIYVYLCVTCISHTNFYDSGVPSNNVPVVCGHIWWRHLPTRDISGRYKGLVRWYLWDTAPWGGEARDTGLRFNYFETKYKNINIIIIIIISVFSVHNVI